VVGEIDSLDVCASARNWIPAFAGMTQLGGAQFTRLSQSTTHEIPAAQFAHFSEEFSSKLLKLRRRYSWCTRTDMAC
jgi:hypothetical protein